MKLDGDTVICGAPRPYHEVHEPTVLEGTGARRWRTLDDLALGWVARRELAAFRDRYPPRQVVIVDRSGRIIGNHSEVVGVGCGADALTAGRRRIIAGGFAHLRLAGDRTCAPGCHPAGVRCTRITDYRSLRSLPDHAGRPLDGNPCLRGSAASPARSSRGSPRSGCLPARLKSFRSGAAIVSAHGKDHTSCGCRR